jgi:methionyl-tRNA synthetase
MEVIQPIEGIAQIQFINYDYFSKIKLKVGRILEAEDIPGKDKLFKLTIDLGEPEKRTLVAGIKPYYTKDELRNKYVIVVANLEPRKLGSFMSQGMLLAASQRLEDGTEKVSLLQPDKDIALGSDVN